ncbi:caspase recruitment domain-containing protein 14-like [Rhincodon typus]|uniref:caspase recruitment domain-containing protein 14-like n=1 Tax=Rhincodon typus TaxID=259920 RepID=UPI00202DF967|nr:caspase recruitment domain-containing protein 14-like [Rhincodon typus]
MDIAVSEDKEIKDLDEESIWDLIESQRHIITSKVRPCHITPFLRQCRVIGETDEEEILFAPHLNHRYMRTGHMLDLLRTRGKKGGLAFLESLGFYNPEIYTLITGKEPTRDCSSMLVEKGNLDLIQFLMNEVMKAQKWLGEEKYHRHRLQDKFRSLEDQNQQLKTELKGLKTAEANLSRIKMDWNHHHDEMIRLKEESYQILMRYTNTLREKEMSVTRSRELYQQVDDLRMENKKLKLEFDVERRMSSKLREAFKPKEDQLLNLKGEIDKLRSRIQELQINPVTIDMLEQERVEALEDKQDLMKEISSLRLELDQAERLRNEYLDEKENMLMECATLKIDCDMYKDKITSLQTQVLELQKERDEAYSARDEAQLQISKTIMDKDLCRRQVIELQDTYRELNKELLQLRSNRNKQEKVTNNKTPPREKPKLKRLQAVNPRTTSYDSDESSCSSQLPLKKPESSPESLLSMTGATAAPEQDWLFLRGPPQMKLMSKISLYKFNGDGILDQIEIIGGNSTGIFIHKIKPGSPAYNCGLEPGFQIMMVENNDRDPKKTVLEDASLEEAVWTLKQIKGMCSLAIRHKGEAYQTLAENIKKKIATSGDSFYIRVNVSFDKESGAIGEFTVQCNEILHITDTIHKGNNEWKAFRVNRNTMADMEGGTIPNYYWAQHLLIGTIRNMMQQPPSSKKQGWKKSSSNQNKFMRIVSTEISQKNPHWLLFDYGTINPNKEQDDKSPGSCFTLMPYSLVRPCHPPSLRPVIIAPTCIGKVVLEKLKDLAEYEKCKYECLNSTEYAAKDRKGDILGVIEVQNLLRSCYTRTAVEAVVAKNAHCLLQLGLDCVKQLHKVEIYPIVIVIRLCEKNIKKIKKIMQKYGVTEDLLLQCYQREETCLDTLPCLYNSIANGWSDLDSLVNLVKAAIKDEQKKIVWIEENPL